MIFITLDTFHSMVPLYPSCSLPIVNLLSTTNISSFTCQDIFLKEKKFWNTTKSSCFSCPRRINRFSWFNTISMCKFCFIFIIEQIISFRILSLRSRTTLSFIVADKSAISIKIQAHVQHWDCYNQYTKSLVSWLKELTVLRKLYYHLFI